jgi:hypothetical protein
MKRSMPEIAAHAAAAMNRHGHEALAQETGRRCAWLEACGYSGLKILAEALADPQSANHVSCVFLADSLQDFVQREGRVFLRNVRHGLYLVPDSVARNYGIGCPIDPGFALGGERLKNPYAEKLAQAEAESLDINDDVWKALD